MKLKVGSILASILLFAHWDAIAQQQYSPDFEIDCSQSRFVSLPDVKCFNTKVVAGGSGSGLFQVWRIRGKNPYVHVRLLEATVSRSYIASAEVGGADHLKSIDARAKAATVLTGPTPYNGADYYRFKAVNGEECAGFRRYGPYRGGGFAWIIGGVICEPKGRIISEDQVKAFIDSVRLK